MTDDNPPGPEPALFSAVLTPHRSLNRSGFVAVMIAISGISFIGGLVFFLIGAWPVVGFFGADVALVYFAFRVNYRAARAYEEVTLAPSELKVRKVSAQGHVSEWTLNPLWVQLHRDEHAEFGMQNIFLVSRGRRLPIGAFLAPEEKESLADALMKALAEAKRGPTRTVLQ